MLPFILLNVRPGSALKTAAKAWLRVGAPLLGLKGYLTAEAGGQRGPGGAAPPQALPPRALRARVALLLMLWSLTLGLAGAALLVASLVAGRGALSAVGFSAASDAYSLFLGGGMLVAAVAAARGLWLAVRSAGAALRGIRLWIWQVRRWSCLLGVPL